MTVTMTGGRDMHGFRFRRWDIYQDSRDLRSKITLCLASFPRAERYVLTDQLKRAMNSVLLNIAEGSNKNTDKEKRTYINRAHGSLDEIVACLDCALDDGYIKLKEHQELLGAISSIAKRLRKFTAHLGADM